MRLPYGATTLVQIEIPRTNESLLLGVCKWWRGQSSSSQRHILDLQLKLHVQEPDQGGTGVHALSSTFCQAMFAPVVSEEWVLWSEGKASPWTKNWMGCGRSLPHSFLLQWGRQGLCIHVLLWPLLLSVVMRLGFLQRWNYQHSEKLSWLKYLNCVYSKQCSCWSW